MKPIQAWAAALVGLWWLCAPVPAQAASSIRVYTEPAGLQFTIDGQTFSGVTDYIWEPNSKHVITGFDQYSADLRVHFKYQCWTTNLDSGCRIGGPITADPNVRWMKLVFIQENLLNLVLFDCAGYDSAKCPSPGTVKINGVPYDRSAQIWLLADSPVVAEAYPAAGFIFTGWAPLFGQTTPLATTPFIIHFLMNGPQQVQPFFWAARPLQVTVQTVPAGDDVQIYADRTAYHPPIDLEWGWDTGHSIGAPPTQHYRGSLYVFDSWNDGGAINHDFKMQPGYTTVSLIAKYVPAATVSFITSPPGLNLTVDGRQNWPSSNFIWAASSTHQVLAPATQTDAQGRKYQFVSWSNGKPAAFAYVMGDSPADDTVTAKYQVIGQVTVNSTPGGIALQVDGSSSCNTPCTFERPAGATVKVTAPGLIQTDPNSRLVFQGWNDSADTSRQLPVSGDPRTYTVAYKRQNRLTLTAVPPEAASFSVDPPAADGFYDAGSLVSIAARVALGFRFNAWSGDVWGLGINTDVALDTPKSGTLLLDRVPAISSGSPRNAAAISPAGVAPGSLITIFGANLAPDLQSGSGSPLPQTLQNVTVRVDGSFLPLVFVSPGQINAQMPLAIPEGTHTLVVRWEGKGETTALVQLARNAPGLFHSESADQPVGSFVKAGGDSVSSDNPAHAGDVITVLGTGFGPYLAPPPDGFLLDEASGYTLADAVTVVLEDGSEVKAGYAGKAGVAVGVDAARFLVPANLPVLPFLKLKIRVADQESNTVLLPVAR